MIERNASDLHLKVNTPPVLRINDHLTFLNDYPKHSSRQLKEIAQSILPPDEFKSFLREHELDMAYSLVSVGRFRLNMFVQRGSIVIVTRAITLHVPEFKTLSLPESVRDMAEKNRGLVLVTGTTGSGKSTTLASLVNHINTTRSTHIISIEDPIEYLHQDKKSIVNQREIGLDTRSFSTALRYLLRQDPDVILIGEIRDTATIEVALGAADTGHLVLSTLHTTDARQTIERIINLFPLDQGNHVRLHLSLNLVGAVSQRLLPRKDKSGLIPAVEVMVNTARIRKAIADNKIYELTQYIGEGEVYGMQTFNQSLYKLTTDGFISQEVALSASSSPEELRMQFRGIFSSGGDSVSSKAVTAAFAAQKRPSKRKKSQNVIPYPAVKDKTPKTSTLEPSTPIKPNSDSINSKKGNLTAPLDAHKKKGKLSDFLFGK